MRGPRGPWRGVTACVAVALTGCSFTVGALGGYRRPTSLPATGEPPCEHREARILDLALGGTLLVGAAAVGGLALFGAVATSDSGQPRDSTIPLVLAITLVASLPSVAFFGSAYYGSREDAACRALPREPLAPAPPATFFCATSPADHYLCFCSRVQSECEERQHSLAAMGAVVEACRPSVADVCGTPSGR